MGRNYQKIQRGYSRSREKEWTQAIVDEDFYEEEIETLSVGGGDLGVSTLMAAAIEREPPALAAVEAEPPSEQHDDAEAAPSEPNPPPVSPYEAMATVAAENNAARSPRKLWRRLTRLMRGSG